MRITADTNILIRAIVADDPKQSQLAQAALADAEIVALTTTALCELVWVMYRHYRIQRSDIAIAMRTLISGANVVVDRPAVEAGLSMLDAGGDFADGAIAFEGAALGGQTFVSFDKDAVKRLVQSGVTATIVRA